MKTKNKPYINTAKMIKKWIVKTTKKVKENDPNDEFGIVYYKSLQSIGITDGKFGFLMQIPVTIEELNQCEVDRIRLDEQAFAANVYQVLPDKPAYPLDKEIYLKEGKPDPFYWTPLYPWGLGDHETEMLRFYMYTHFPVHPRHLLQLPHVVGWQVYHMRAVSPDYSIINPLLFESSFIGAYLVGGYFDYEPVWINLYYLVKPVDVGFKPYETPEWVKRFDGGSCYCKK
jgi:hypothetical protein